MACPLTGTQREGNKLCSTSPQNYPVGSEQYICPGLSGHCEGPGEVSGPGPSLTQTPSFLGLDQA